MGALPFDVVKLLPLLVMLPVALDEGSALVEELAGGAELDEPVPPEQAPLVSAAMPNCVEYWNLPVASSMSKMP